MFPQSCCSRSARRPAPLLAMLVVGSLAGCSTRDLPVTPGTAALGPAPEVGAAASTAAQTIHYEVRTFDVPATLGDFTSAFGINDFGVIVGNFAAPDGSVHGFLFQGGEFTDVVVPGAGDADLGCVNNLGLAAGGYSDASDVEHMFLRDRRGRITPLPDALPGALATDGTGINVLGSIAGTVIDANGSTHGFTRVNGVVTVYDHPGSIRTRLLGINDLGQVVGFWADAGGTRHGLLLDAGTATEIAVPGAVGTGCTGINNRGQIVGFYSDGSITHGFLLDRGTV